MLSAITSTSIVKLSKSVTPTYFTKTRDTKKMNTHKYYIYIIYIVIYTLWKYIIFKEMKAKQFLIVALANNIKK